VSAQAVAGRSQAAGRTVVRTRRTPIAVPPTGRTVTAYSTAPGVTETTRTEASTRTSRTGATGTVNAEADRADPGSGTSHATAGTVIAAVPMAVRTVLDTAFIPLPPTQMPVGLRGDGPGAREAIAPHYYRTIAERNHGRTSVSGKLNVLSTLPTGVERSSRDD
jgi:hypothetical protein